MKIRTGFVSNSSSSSFLLDLNKLTTKQIRQIRLHAKIAVTSYVEEFKQDSPRYADYGTYELTHRLGSISRENGKLTDGWLVRKHGQYLYCGTLIDNFDLTKFIEMIGANKAIVARQCDNYPARYRGPCRDVLAELNYRYERSNWEYDKNCPRDPNETSGEKS